MTDLTVLVTTLKIKFVTTIHNLSPTLNHHNHDFTNFNLTASYDSVVVDSLYWRLFLNLSPTSMWKPNSSFLNDLCEHEIECVIWIELLRCVRSKSKCQFRDLLNLDILVWYNSTFTKMSDFLSIYR